MQVYWRKGHNMKILIVDDDQDLSMIIADMLEDQGHEALHVTNLEETYELLEREKVALILLDINLPDGTGFELCEELRRVSEVPVIFVSARTSEDDKIIGLDMGGDDYLAKPFSLKELMSRINSLLRRTYGYGNASKVRELHAGEDNRILIDESSRTVTRNGEQVSLSPMEYDLLLYLTKHAGTALPKEKILNEVWGAFSQVEPSTLTVHIRWLRTKLEKDVSNPELIKTVWGVGYMLQGESNL